METSTNLASIKPQPSDAGGQAVFAVQCSTRSSLMPALEQVRKQTSEVAGGCWFCNANNLTCSAARHLAAARRPLLIAALNHLPLPVQVRSSIGRIGRLCGAEVEQVRLTVLTPSAASGRCHPSDAADVHDSHGSLHCQHVCCRCSALKLQCVGQAIVLADTCAQSC